MSFDVFFQPCRYSGNVVEQEDPFTGEIRTVHMSEPLTDDELRSVQQVLERAGADGPDEFGCYVIELDDGGELEVFGSDPATGCMAALRGLSPGVLRYLFDLLKAGNWAMLPAMEDAVAITTSQEHVRGAPDDFPAVVVCSSPDELGVVLAKGIESWETYRDQMLDGEE